MRGAGGRRVRAGGRWRQRGSGVESGPPHKFDLNGALAAGTARSDLAAAGAGDECPLASPTLALVSTIRGAAGLVVVMEIDGRSEADDFDLFFRGVFPKTVAVAERITGERSSAEDAAVDALAKAYVRWRRVGGRPRREAWVCKVAVNEAIRRLPRSGAAVPVPAAGWFVLTRLGPGFAGRGLRGRQGRPGLKEGLQARQHGGPALRDGLQDVAAGAKSAAVCQRALRPAGQARQAGRHCRDNHRDRARIVACQALCAFGALLSVLSTYLSIGFIFVVQLNAAIAPRIWRLDCF